MTLGHGIRPRKARPGKFGSPSYFFNNPCASRQSAIPAGAKT
jgi:hypothetical protein